MAWRSKDVTIEQERSLGTWGTMGTKSGLMTWGSGLWYGAGVGFRTANDVQFPDTLLLYRFVYPEIVPIVPMGPRLGNHKEKVGMARELLDQLLGEIEISKTRMQPRTALEYVPRSSIRIPQARRHRPHRRHRRLRCAA
jgi:hypothetical protein